MFSQATCCSLSYCCCMQAHAISPLSKQSISIIARCRVVMKLEGESLHIQFCLVGNCVTQARLCINTHTPVRKTWCYFFPWSMPICLSPRGRHNTTQRRVGKRCTCTVSDRESETEAYDIAPSSWNASWLFDAVFSLWEPGVLKMDLNNNITHPTHAPTGKSRGEAICCETSRKASRPPMPNKHLRNCLVTRMQTHSFQK